MTNANIPVLVQCASLAEAQVAYDAILAFRGGVTIQYEPSSHESASDSLTQRVYTALAKTPLNRTRQLILEQLLKAGPEAWVPYSSLQESLALEGFTDGQAQAAVRDISWQMREFMPAEDLAGYDRPFNILIDKSRTAGVYQYRLTAVGRNAVEIYLAEQPRNEPPIVD